MSREDREHWDRKHATRLDAETPAAPFLVAHAHLLPPGRLLDVAAGTGRNARFLAGLGHRVIALDVSGVALRAARAAMPSIACVQMDLDRPGIRPGACDAVVVVGFLDRRLLDPVVDWVRPGGVVLWDTFLREPGAVGHPRNPAWLLERGELRARFGPRCEILAGREGAVDEAGSVSFRSGIVARRRA